MSCMVVQTVNEVLKERRNKKDFVGGLWSDWDENSRDQMGGGAEWSRRVVGEINGIGGLWGAMWRVSALQTTWNLQG